MSKRYNSVSLDGVLTVNEVNAYLLKQQPTVYAELTCSTNEPGGQHRVFAYGRQAVEAISFSVVATNGKIPLEATIRGYLWSHNGDSATVAEEVVFHINRSSRAEAVCLMAQLMQNPEVVTYQGRIIPLKKLLDSICRPVTYPNSGNGKIQAVHINVSSPPD